MRKVLLLSLLLVGSSTAFSPSPKNSVPSSSSSVRASRPMTPASSPNQKGLHSSNNSDRTKPQYAKSIVVDSDKLRRTKWGVDNQNEDEYWFNDQIHIFGNTGFLGAFHAAVAPLSTKLIDDAAYQGQDVRKTLSEELAKMVRNKKARVADLCCGVGMSTRALQDAFPEAETVLGIDTSPEMISMAQFLTRHLAMVKPWVQRTVHQLQDSAYQALKKRGYATRKRTCYSATKFLISNAEHTQLPAKSFDLVTIMYAFHEAPQYGRERMLREAHRLLAPGGTLAVIDIATDYEPSASMLAGEPYVREYQANIHRQLFQQTLKGYFVNAKYKTVVPKHLGMWTLKRAHA